MSSAAARKTQIYVSRLSSKVTKDDLKSAFKKYGKIRSIALKIGYAFIEFDDPKDAEDAVEGMDGKTFQG